MCPPSSPPSPALLLLLLALLVPSVHVSQGQQQQQRQQQNHHSRRHQAQQQQHRHQASRELRRKIHDVPDLNLPQPPPNPSPSDYWDGEGKRDGIYDGGVTAATAAPEDGSGGGVSGPFINRGLSGDVVGVLGKEVRLNCHVTNLGNKTISWMRLRDLRLLTVGRYKYTPDRRFSPLHIPLTHFWQLRIAEVRRSDEGYYECQVSSTPPRGHQIKLSVVEPHTEILGGPDMHVDRGSTINLTCLARFSPAPPPDVEWYHNNEVISYDSPRGGVSLVIEKGESTTSHLLIQRAAAADSGVYRCVPANTVEARINLHILRGKNPDAWQTSGSTPRIPSLLSSSLSLILLLVLSRREDL